MAFASTVDVCDAQDTLGRTMIRTWRKAPVQATAAGIWFDLSMSPGNPPPQYYAAAPNIAIQLARSTDGGLDHGAAVSPSTKYLRRLTIMCQTAAPLPMSMILCDYLLFYPFADESSTDPQTLDNTVTIPRYTDGAGVQIMAIVVGGQTGGQTFQVSYTNSAGVAGRTSGTVTCNSQGLNGTVITTATATNGCAGPFIPLQSGDSGVRSIQSITFNGADVGVLTLVLVKPLASLQVRGIDAPVEVDFLKDWNILPIIKDDAYLNLLCLPAGSLNAAPMHGDITVAWG